MTNYNDPAFLYNAAIPYNGVVVPPTPTPTKHFVGGGYAYPPQFPRKKKKEPNEEDEVIAIMLAEFMEDE